MKFVIDKEQCTNINIKISTALYLAALYFGQKIDKDTLSEVRSKSYIYSNGIDANGFPIQPSLTQEGVDLLETIFVNSEFREPNKKEDRFDLLAEKLRELYPQGKKGNTPYTWRDSKTAIARKLKTLVKRTGISFTDEQAIDATKRYVESFNGNYQYMKLLKYFIFKLESKVGEDGNVFQEETSELLNYIDNTEESINTDNGELV